MLEHIWNPWHENARENEKITVWVYACTVIVLTQGVGFALAAPRSRRGKSRTLGGGVQMTVLDEMRHGNIVK